MKLISDKIRLIFTLFCLGIPLTDTLADPAVEERFSDVIEYTEERPGGLAALQTTKPYSRSFNSSRSARAYFQLHTDSSLDVHSNELLEEVATYYLNNRSVLEGDDPYWAGEYHAAVLAKFGSNGTVRKDAVSRETEVLLLQFMLAFLKEHSNLSLYESSLENQTYFYQNSENHWWQRVATCWGYLLALKDDPDFEDEILNGESLQETYEQTAHYVAQHMEQRARKGFLLEISSGNYPIRMRNMWFMIHDIAPDDRMRKLAKNTLDLWWAFWTEEQVSAERGGGKVRHSRTMGLVSNSDFQQIPAWLYFGIGKPLAGSNWMHTRHYMALLSSYRPNEVIYKIQNDRQTASPYAVTQRRLGKEVPGGAKSGRWYNFNQADILKSSWVAPNFVLGTVMRPPYDEDVWNHDLAAGWWHGLLIAGSDPADPPERVVPLLATAKTSISSDQYAVQSKGSIMTHRLPGNNSYPMGVFISNGLEGNTEHDGGFLFINSPRCWVALRAVSGSFSENDGNLSNEVKDNGIYYRSGDRFKPVIMETAEPGDYVDFDAFVAAVRNAQLVSSVNGKHDYHSLSGDVLTMFDDYSNPMINGSEIDYNPGIAYSSRYVHSDWDSGAVTLSAGGAEVVLNFTEEDDMIAPNVAAGEQTIMLPDNQVTLTGTAEDDGTIISLEWTQDSGPSTATLSGADSLTLTASDLVAGTYVFRLSATDDENNIGSATVSVLVEEYRGPNYGDAMIVDFTHEIGQSNARAHDSRTTTSQTWDFSNSTPLVSHSETGSDSNTKLYGGMHASWSPTNDTYGMTLQLRADQGLILQVNPLTEGRKELEGCLVWDKEDFLEHSTETVVFDAESSISLNIAQAVTMSVRYVVNDGGTYYVSNTSVSGVGLKTLNDPEADSWAVLNTTDYSWGAFSSHEFTDIQGFGFYINASRDTGTDQVFIRIDDFQVSANVQSASIVDFTQVDGVHRIRTADVDSVGGDEWTFSDSTPLFDGAEIGDDSNTKIYGGLQTTWNNADYAPNLLLRGSDDILQMQVNADTTFQGLEGMLVWNKADFLNHTGETVVFNSTSSMSLIRANSGSSTTVRFVVNDGGIYYVSNTSGAGSMTLSDPGADAWAPIDTADYSIGTYTARSFSDIQGVGVYIEQSGSNQTIFKLSDFQVSAIAKIPSGNPTLEAWLAEYGLSGDNADWDADLENGGVGDGMNNLMEYALGGNPLSYNGPDFLPTHEMSTDDPVTIYLYFTHKERTDDPSLTYTVEYRSDLASNDWGTQGVEFVEESDLSDGWKTITSRCVVDESGFMRLKVQVE